MIFVKNNTIPIYFLYPFIRRLDAAYSILAEYILE